MMWWDYIRVAMSSKACAGDAGRKYGEKKKKKREARKRDLGKD